MPLFQPVTWLAGLSLARLGLQAPPFEGVEPYENLLT